MSNRSEEMRALIEAAAAVALDVSVEAYRKPYAIQHNVARPRLAELLDALVPFVGSHTREAVQRRRRAIEHGDGLWRPDPSP